MIYKQLVNDLGLGGVPAGPTEVFQRFGLEEGERGVYISSSWFGSW